jgi:hypothetical protein
MDILFEEMDIIIIVLQDCTEPEPQDNQPIHHLFEIIRAQ